MNQNEQRDHEKFYIEKGDPGFSPERNKSVIERTIKSYETFRKKKQKEYKDAVGERTDALATYLTSLKSGTPLEAYFGKREMARLRGERIVQNLKTSGLTELIEIS